MHAVSFDHEQIGWSYVVIHIPVLAQSCDRLKDRPYASWISNIGPLMACRAFDEYIYRRRSPDYACEPAKGMHHPTGQHMQSCLSVGPFLGWPDKGIISVVRRQLDGHTVWGRLALDAGTVPRGVECALVSWR